MPTQPSAVTGDKPTSQPAQPVASPAKGHKARPKYRVGEPAPAATKLPSATLARIARALAAA